MLNLLKGTMATFIVAGLTLAALLFVYSLYLLTVLSAIIVAIVIGTTYFTAVENSTV